VTAGILREMVLVSAGQGVHQHRQRFLSFMAQSHQGSRLGADDANPVLQFAQAKKRHDCLLG
jgi:hypothetical protein